MNELNGKTAIITGASRGIGRAIGRKLASAGANIVILAKDRAEQIAAASEEIIAAGGAVLALDVDLSDVQAIRGSIDRAIERFKGIDILVNNTSWTCFNGTLDTSPEEFDRMVATSVRAAFFMSQACIPYLKEAANPHILNISPPVNLETHWFKEHLGFSLSKYAMSLCTLGMAEEFKEAGIAVNSLWPQSTIATQTITDHFSKQVYDRSRWPSIMGDAAFELILRSASQCTGHFFTDEQILQEAGIVDFSHYAVEKGSALMQALFVSQEAHTTPITQDLFLK